MSYKSLYRKFRPKKFADVVGQDINITILKNSIINNKISHAYIFSGPRGTGKTSTAKIFAKAVNCLNFKDDLCGNCETCKSNFDDEIDIIEIDAASNNGVDEIREIKNNVNMLPVKLKYKVYIIDEVHMLSLSAFNALLKTLEEPPSHTIFILATTEINKIPSTVLSRCQKFDFKKINKIDLVTQLKFILKSENYNIDDNILELIANLSDGGLRDAINLLDQLLSLNIKDIDENDVYDLIGELNETDFKLLFNNIINSDIKNTLKLINDLYEKGKNFNNIINRLLLFTKNIIINNNTDDYFDEIQINLLNEFRNIKNEKLEALSNILVEFISEIKKSNNQKIVIEIYFIKMCLLFKSTNEIIEKKQFNNNIKENDIVKVNNENIIYDKNIRINNSFFGASKVKKDNIIKLFDNVKKYLYDKDYNSISNLLLKSNIEVVSDNYILFSFKNEFEVVLFDKNYIDIEKFLILLFNNKFKVCAITYKNWIDEKNKYLENIKNNYIYNYIEEKKVEIEKNNNNVLEKSLDNVFGENIVTFE